MNIKQWQKLCQINQAPRKYDNLSRQMQKSLQYNQNPLATVRHHLRDTEEQRKYNDAHYEMWGFNLDGTFEYGKYIIFVTPEEHCRIHADTAETRIKKSMSGYKAWQDTNKRANILNSRINIVKSPLTELHKQHLSEAHKGHKATVETKYKMSQTRRGPNNPNYGKPKSDETKEKLRKACHIASLNKIKIIKLLYAIAKQYLNVTWNQFQHKYTNAVIADYILTCFYVYIKNKVFTCEYAPNKLGA